MAVQMPHAAKPATWGRATFTMSWTQAPACEVSMKRIALNRPSVDMSRSGHPTNLPWEVELFRITRSHMSEVLLVESCCCQRMPCHASSSWHGNAFGTQRSVYAVAQATCACPKLGDRPSGHFAHTPNKPHGRSSCFASLRRPMSSPFEIAVVLRVSGVAMPC